MIHMRKKAFLTLALAALLLFLASVALADTGIVNTPSGLYLREEPNGKSAALDLVREGAKVEILDKIGDWYEVSYGKYTGYVYGKYIDLIEESKKDGDTLQRGDKGELVKKLQKRLTELGYYKSTCDGNFGYVTQTAVKAFQKKNGLTQTGVADENTQKKLYSSSALSANATVSNNNDDKKDDAADETSLKKGSRGEAVKKLQQRLKELGYYAYGCDGDYGYRTVAAVKAFQKKNGLTQDGIAGSVTLKKLNSSSAIPAKEEVKDDADNGDDKKDEEVQDEETLRKGSKGEAVKKLQQRLKDLGYYTPGVDSSYGDKTAAAVKAFQKKNGLTADGVAGASTLKKLYDDSARNVDGLACVILKTSQTLKQGSSGDQVRALQVNLAKLGYYNGSLDHEYGYQTAAAVSEFQRCNGLTVTGTANSTTLRKLLSSSAISKDEADKKQEEEDAAKNPVTERLDWFKDGVNTFPQKAIIEVKDVRTGLVFKAQVLYGSNHLDVEPLTKADTAILLKINGGVEFSWRRRPMLVKYAGRVYASSIYSEPHGDQTILDNDFEGQFCLHFYGSKTHGTEEIKQDHQACVAEAMNATW